MHLEVLVEDSSGKLLLEHLIPRILGAHGDPHTWRVISYKGVGRIPPNLHKTPDPSKRILLDQLPRLLRGYGQTPGVDAVVVVVDSDTRNCIDFLAELKKLAGGVGHSSTKILFRIAIEEIEAWYFGDRKALLAAYPRAKVRVLDSYVQDSICGTWEKLADAVVHGGSAEIKKAGWPRPGELKHEWADRIGRQMDVEANRSPSFRKLREGLLKLVSEPSST
jgi:Domain of unknown function (DUF4276)